MFQLFLGKALNDLDTILYLNNVLISRKTHFQTKLIQFPVSNAMSYHVMLYLLFNNRWEALYDIVTITAGSKGMWGRFLLMPPCTVTNNSCLLWSRFNKFIIKENMLADIEQRRFAEYLLKLGNQLNTMQLAYYVAYINFLLLKMNISIFFRL